VSVWSRESVGRVYQEEGVGEFSPYKILLLVSCLLGLPATTPLSITKFDYSYIIIMKVGSEILRGLLYHPPAEDSTSSEQPNNGDVVNDISPSTSHGQRSRQRRRTRVVSGRPKFIRNSYNFFFSHRLIVICIRSLKPRSR
ncbi:hypothetical protein GIB67_024566, partial [Kingdonia uniflora]